MWPAKRDLGSQITYGVSGNGLVVPEQSGPSTYRPKLLFPRLRDDGLLLNPIMNSKVQLLGKNEEKTHLPTPFRPHNARTKYPTSAPEEVVISMMNEAAVLDEPLVIDPKKGSTTAVFEIGTGGYSYLIFIDGKRKFPKAKNSFVQMQAIAYVTGSDRNVLNVAALMPRKKQLYGIDDSQDHQLTPLKKVLVGFPKHTIQCRFPVEIMQVKPFHHDKLLAVRTRMDVTVLEYSWKNDPGDKGIVLKKLGVVTSAQLDGKTFAHLEVNPLVKSEFLTIDEQGSIGIWNCNVTSQIEPISRTTYIAASKKPEEFSSWRKAFWSRDGQRILLFSRTSIYQIHLSGDFKRDKVVTAQMWSHVQDVVEAGPFAFILTSKEIIWTEMADKIPLRRLVSWKHFLDDTDVSSRLSLVPCEGNNTFVCAVYSRQSPLIMIYTFGFVNERPCSLRDPYYITASSKQLVEVCLSKSAFTGEGEQTLVNLLEVGKQGEVCFSVLAGSRKKAFKKLKSTREPDCDLPAPILFSKIQINEAITAFHHYSSKNILKQDSGTQNDEETQNEEDKDQDDLIQEFASRLGSEIHLYFDVSGQQSNDSENQALIQNNFANTDVKVRVPLESVAGYVPLCILDFEQFDNMIEQLALHYISLGLSLENIMEIVMEKYRQKFPTFDGKCTTVKSFRKILGKMFKKEPHLDTAAILLASRLIQVAEQQSSSRLQAALDEVISLASSEVKSILNEWDEPQQEQEQSTKTSQFLQSPSVPIVNTQSNAQSRVKTKTGRNGLLHRALTQSQISASQAPNTANQNGQASSPLSSQAFTHSSEIPPTQIALGTSQPTQVSHSLPPLISVSPSSSQSSQSGLKRSGPQSLSQKRKKRKGGFA